MVKVHRYDDSDVTKMVKVQTQNEKSLKILYFFIIDGNIWGSHLVGHPDERKG
jgi:hypothetical protein